MTDNFSTVKDRIDLAELILSLSGGKIPTRNGEEVKINPCPFCQHNDCFTVYGEEKRYHCFSGSCGADGDCFDYIQITKSMDNIAALRFLAERAGIPLEEKPREGYPEGRGPSGPDSKHRIWSDAAEYYSSRLFKNDEARDYQTVTRGHNADLLRRFNVGFADGGLYRTLKVSYSDEELLSSGLIVRKDDGTIRDFFFGGQFVYPHKMTTQNTWFDVGDWTSKPLPKSGSKQPSFRLKDIYRDPDALFYNQAALSHRTVIVCEGQNDLLSIVGKGGCNDVIATTGQLSKWQLEALNREAEHSKPDKPKQIFLCFDRDEAGDTYTEKVVVGIKDKGKDGEDGQRKYGLHETLLPPRVHQLMPSYKYCQLYRVQWYSVAKDIDEYLTAIDEADAGGQPDKGGTDAERALKRLMDDSVSLYQDIDESMKIYRRGLADATKGGADPFFGPESAKTQGEILFDWLGGNRAFFVDRVNPKNMCFSHDGKVYQIDKNEPTFTSLLYRLLKVTMEEKRGKILSAVLGAMAHNQGRVLDVVNWFHMDSDGSLMIHSGRRDEAIIRISPGEISIVPNGRKCLMRPSPQIHAIDYTPDVNVRRCMDDLRRLVLNNLPCSVENRYFILSWLLYTWMIGLSRDRPLLHVTGDSSAGKTTVANLIAALTYGNDEVSVSSVAALWEDGSKNPVVLLDNLENEKITPQIREFLMGAATGVERHIKNIVTRQGNEVQKLNCQVIITSIEPLGALREMNNRLWAVECSKQYWSEGFNKMEALKVVKERRAELLSAWFQIVAKEILPTWRERKRHYLEYLQLKHEEAAKERMVEFFAGMLVILETVLKYIPDERNSKLDPELQLAALVKEMFAAQKTVSEEADTYSNPIASALDSLKDHLLYAESVDGFEREFKIRCASSSARDSGERYIPKNGTVVFRGTPTAFQHTFTYLSNAILRNRWPYSSVFQFSARLKDSLAILAKSGWTVDMKHSGGERIYEFSRPMIPTEIRTTETRTDPVQAAMTLDEDPE